LHKKKLIIITIQSVRGIELIIKKIIAILLLLLCIFFAIMIIEPEMLEVNEITVQSSQIPEEFNGTRIALIADFHYGEYVNEDRVRYVVSKTNEQNPDIIILGGDYVTDNKENILPCINILSDLKAPYGVYAVLGNNDPKDATEESINQTHIKSIRNQGLWIEKNGEKIRLGGVGDLSTDYQYPRITTNPATTDDFVIMVYHNPNYFPLLNHNLTDLSLSGHTHGGQINFFGYAPRVQPASNGKQYLSGLYEEDGSQLIVTNGVGQTKLPFRFMAVPQITIVKLESMSTW